MLKKFEPDALIKAFVALGIISLAGLALHRLVDSQSALVPVFLTTLLGLLAALVYHYFPKRD